MSSRVSDTTLFDNAVRNNRLNRLALSQIQEKLSSGKQVNSVGDDPIATTQILSLRREIGRLDQFDRNIEAARSNLEHTESTLNSLTDTIARLREITVSADIETQQFDLIKPEVEQLFAQVLSLANTRVGERYLFAGFDTDTAPFTQVGAFVNGVIDTTPPLEPYAQYNGDNGVIQIRIGEATTVNASVTGRVVFFGSADGNDTPDTGNVDIFAVIRDLRNRLEDPAVAGNPLDMIDELDAALNQVLHVRGTVGATLNRLEMNQAQLRNFEVSLQTQRSGVEDLDFIAASTQLANLEHVFQASLATTARVLQPTLLNFLS